MAVPLKQPITWEVQAHCDLYPSHLLEGAVVQLHICISIEPYSVLHSLLTAAYEKAIFHKVCERRRGTELTITWRRQRLWSRIDGELETNREKIVSSHPIDIHLKLLYNLTLINYHYTLFSIFEIPWNYIQELISKGTEFQLPLVLPLILSFSMILMTISPGVNHSRTKRYKKFK